MRTKEECSWCMSTPDIERKIDSKMPEEFKFRCSACHELWYESHADCDYCDNIIDLDAEADRWSYDITTHLFKCKKCSAGSGT